MARKSVGMLRGRTSVTTSDPVSRVANNEAVTDQSLVAGLVTMGPTMTRDVSARMRA